MMKLADNPISIIETSPILEDSEIFVESVLKCKVLIWEVGLIVKSSAYAPSIPLEIRGMPYGVLHNEVIELDGNLEVEQLETIPKPSVEIAPFSLNILPRVKNLPEHIEREIIAARIKSDSA
jgi:hypothetical protein